MSRKIGRCYAHYVDFRPSLTENLRRQKIITLPPPISPTQISKVKPKGVDGEIPKLHIIPKLYVFVTIPTLDLFPEI